MVIFQADSEDDAEEIVANDPVVTHKVMDARLFPYNIAVLSPAILKAQI